MSNSTTQIATGMRLQAPRGTIFKVSVVGLDRSRVQLRGAAIEMVRSMDEVVADVESGQLRIVG